MSDRINERTRRMALSALFCALAFLATLLPSPKVSFLSFDIKDTVIATASLMIGPSAAVSLSIAVPLLEFITVGTTGPWGLLMDVLSTAAFSVTASFIYNYRKTLGGAVLSLSVAALLQIAVMMLANILITPLYLSVDAAGVAAARKTVIAMLPTLLLPFNAVKSVFNASLVMLLYKPLTEALRRAGVLSGRGGEGTRYTLGGRTLVVLLLSLAVVVGMMLVLFLVLGASFPGGEA